ncbi:bifunctional metallophosphatase/5'-nucleotidase [Moheibacter sp.]|uniref:bifunctional metallophosphatase/5'-nucleotidase n=1 Tax=Moheibacter sp. TaxID=1965316 RepID=UPI003C730454
MENRREFIKKAAAASLLTMVPTANLLAEEFNKTQKITILHTNDQHSRIEPFEPSSDETYSNKGGFARRAALIHQIRQQEENVLLLDAGDVVQGTPYFNLFGGDLEYKLMSQMGYDVGTLGNHEFDNGLEGIKSRMPHAKFEIVIANYDFTNTLMEGFFKPYKVIQKSGVRIGIFGVGVDLTGLVSRDAYGEMKYYDPIEIAQDMSRILREEEKCDLVICLSHIGYEYQHDDGVVSDKHLAKKTSGIDLIIGGHTHTFLPQPEEFLNAKGKTVLYNQVGWAGLFLGRIDFHLQHGKVQKYTAYGLNDYLVDGRLV